MELNERLKLVREKSGLSQREFSKVIGVVRSAYTAFENGDRTPKDVYLKSICFQFSVNEKWLFHGIGEMDRSDDNDQRDSDIVEVSMMLSALMKDSSPDTRSKIKQIFKDLIYVLKDRERT